MTLKLISAQVAEILQLFNRSASFQFMEIFKQFQLFQQKSICFFLLSVARIIIIIIKIDLKNILA